MLRQRLDGEQLLVPPGPFPVGHDLDPPEACPFPDELQSAGIEAAGEHLPVHRDRGPPPGMVGMEVGHRVIALVPVHVDDDSIERADTRHGLTIADSSTTRRIADLVQDAAFAVVPDSDCWPSYRKPAVPYNPADSEWLAAIFTVRSAPRRSTGYVSVLSMPLSWLAFLGSVVSVGCTGFAVCGYGTGVEGAAADSAVV